MCCIVIQLKTIMKVLLFFVENQTKNTVITNNVIYRNGICEKR